MTDLTNSIHDRLAALMATPCTHASLITYSDGSVQKVDHRSAAAAESYLSGYRRLIGKHEYISRTTGKKITIVSCEVLGLN
jgi:hypothetical protein